MSGHPIAGSRTAALARAVSHRIAEETAAVPGGFIDLAVTGPDEHALRVTEWAVSVWATPTIKGSYSGLTKMLVDRLPAAALEGRTAVPLVTAASQAHLVQATRHLVEVLRELGCRVAEPFAVLVTDGLDLTQSVDAWFAVARASVVGER